MSTAVEEAAAAPPPSLDAAANESTVDSNGSGQRRPSLLARLSSKRADGEPGVLRRLSTSISRLGRRSSSASLPPLEEIPPNFLKACKGSVEKAGRKWLASRQWRDENDIDHILERPHPNFDTFKQVYPVFIHGRDLQGNAISVEQPGKMDAKLMKSAGLTPKDFTMQLALYQEYFWERLNTQHADDFKITTIFDAKGMSLGSLASADNLALIRAASEVLNNHYPERVNKILIVNAPRFFAPAFKILSAVMPASVRDQLHVCGALSELEAYIAREQIPKEYGGDSPFPLGEAAEEKGLRALVAAEGGGGGGGGGSNGGGGEASGGGGASA